MEKIITARQKKYIRALPKSWQHPLETICASTEIDRLIQFLQERESAGARIYPEKKNIFAALHATSFDDVRVVIIGQDPYHGPGQAHGLSFSVRSDTPIPPSLKNIFKELSSDIILPASLKGDLSAWAAQGVLLLNAVLTVEEGKPASHAHKGWELFTDEIVKKLLMRNKPLVLLLWGAYAQKKIANLHEQINPEMHQILQAAHPSPLSVRGFLGCKHFSKTNTFLKAHQMPEINWAKTI